MDWNTVDREWKWMFFNYKTHEGQKLNVIRNKEIFIWIVLFNRWGVIN